MKIVTYTKIAKIVLVLFLGGLFAACDFPTPTPEPCTPGSFGTPALLSPNDFDVVGSLTPTLSWSYASDCDPTGFRIELATNPDFTGGTIGGNANFPTMTWSPSSPLMAAKEYWWRVAAITERPGDILYGPFSPKRRFFTGPICAPPDFEIPSNVRPLDGEVVDTVMPMLEWEYPEVGCVPEGYRVDLSTDPSFVDTSLSGGTGNPSTDWFPGDDLVDCMTYYWRIAPITGTTLGEFSETWSFTINLSGICPGGATITGVVWHDLCAVPYESIPPGDPLPEGCIDTGGGGLEANGIFEPGEPGIEGVTLRLGNGACPSSGLATDTTDVNGVYAFGGLTAGTYCVSVDALTDGNDLVLIPGGWTYLVRGANPQEVAFTLVGFELETDVNFGWDYQFLPAPAAPPAPTPTPTSVPEVKINFNADSYAIKEGECTTLRWQVDNATDVFLDGDVVEHLDARQVCPPQTTRYTMLVIHPGGEELAFVTIEIVMLPSPPDAPARLVISERMCNEKVYRITLKWVDVADNEKGYKVYRDGKLLATLPANSTSFVDEPDFGTHTFEVMAYNDGGNSAKVSKTDSCSP